MGEIARQGCKGGGELYAEGSLSSRALSLPEWVICLALSGSEVHKISVATTARFHRGDLLLWLLVVPSIQTNLSNIYTILQILYGMAHDIVCSVRRAMQHRR